MEETFELSQAVGKEFDRIEQWWLKLVNNIKDLIVHQEKADDTASNIINNTERLQYTLPEVKGRLLTLLGTAPTPNEDIRTAMLLILAYVQSKGDYDNVVQHLNLDGSKISTDTGRKKLHQLLGYDAVDYIDSVPGFNKEFFVDAKEIIATIDKDTPVQTLVNVQHIKEQYSQIKAVEARNNYLSRVFST